MLSIESILTVYQALISVTCFALLGIATWNLFRFARIRPTSSAPDLSKQPLISVLVPARNEERAIGACVESLCRQAYDRYEVIVLDDGSTDATPEILAALSQRFPDRLKVVQGSTLPVGWVGKSWACHNLSTHASGEYLLFVDADTVHEPTMLSSALDFAQARSLDFFSMIPTEVMETWGEKLIIPFVHFMYFAYLPNNLITNNPEVSVSAANGQFMFFSREAYQKVGGHVAVQNNLVEDVFLAKACKKAGLKIALVDGTPIVACRMYTDFQTTIDGF